MTRPVCHIEGKRAYIHYVAPDGDEWYGSLDEFETTCPDCGTPWRWADNGRVGCAHNGFYDTCGRSARCGCGMRAHEIVDKWYGTTKR